MTEIKSLKEQKESRDSPGRSGISAPYFDLASSIIVAEVIYKNGGGTCSAEQLAAWLGYKSTASGTYLTRISAANKHFGLIDSSGDAFSVTERGKKILAPVMPEDAEGAKVEAFLGVPLFSKIYEQFKGSSLPPEIGLKNLFRTTYRILPDRINQTTRVFLNSAEQAGFFSTTGDRSRLIRPNSAQAKAQPQEKTDSAPPVERSRSGGGGSDGTSGVHTAIVGLLRELPGPGSTWTSADQKGFLDAFTAMIKFIYPARSDAPHEPSKSESQ